jgi:hypothetical protein
LVFEISMGVTLPYWPGRVKPQLCYVRNGRARRFGHQNVTPDRFPGRLRGPPVVGVTPMLIVPTGTLSSGHGC